MSHTDNDLFFDDNHFGAVVDDKATSDSHASSAPIYPYTLSLCLPTYNRAQCLKEQLNRLLTIAPNDLKRIEIIVSDNCSTDDTQLVVDDYRDKLQFTYIRNDQNLGADRNF